MTEPKPAASSAPFNPALIGPMSVAAVVAAIAFPGAGHFLMGQRGKGILVAIVLIALIALGLDLGRGSNFTTEAYDRHSVMYVMQWIAGAPAWAAYWMRPSATPIDAFADAKLFETALLYTCVAGLLNLLLIVDAGTLPGRLWHKAQRDAELKRKAEAAALVASTPLSPPKPTTPPPSPPTSKPATPSAAPSPSAAADSASEAAPSAVPAPSASAVPESAGKERDGVSSSSDDRRELSLPQETP